MLGFLRRFFGSGQVGHTAYPGNRFFLDVECEGCGERFHLHINRATDCVQIFDEPGVAWRLQRQVVGSQCRSIMHVRLDIGASGQIIHRDISHGRFVDPEQE
jgi:hypothetical protein